jgi:hypothetical protein
VYQFRLTTIPAPLNPPECRICRYGSWDNTHELVSVAVVEPSAGRYADCALHPLHRECLLESFVSEDGSREISNRCPTRRREVFQQIRQPTALNSDNFPTALLDDSDEDDDDDDD